MALNIDGIYLNPIQSGYNPDMLIYRPESGLPSGLLDGGEDPAFTDTLANFAGGLLSGYQRIGDQFVPVNPSGVFTGSGEPNEAGMSEGKGRGAYTISDLMEMQTGVSQANFGGYEPISVFSYFDQKDDGTFDLKEDRSGVNQNYIDAFYSSVGEYGSPDAKTIPMQEVINQATGEPIGVQRAVQRIKRNLANIDMSD